MKKEKGQLTRWLQGLGLVYVLWFLPVTEAVKASITETEVMGAVEPGPVVALTFDDGPNVNSTPILLDGLKERGVKATFFVIGENIEKDGNEEIIRRMHEEGHLIGNHTYHHADLSALSEADARREIEMTDSRIEEITGEEPALIRPPFGEFPRNMENEISKLYVKWTVDPLDWTTDDTSLIVRRVVAEVEENDIILLHDCYESSVQAAFEIIDILQEEGYEFVTADRIIIE